MKPPGSAAPWGAFSWSRGAFLDVGSSTAEFRERAQPHIHEEIFRPLEQRRLEVVYLDAKDGDGVDVTCDVTTEGSRRREHVRS